MNSLTLSDWVTPNSVDRVDFGHYEYDPNTIHTAEVWRDIFTILSAQKGITSLIVVSSDAGPRQDPIRRGWEMCGQDGDSLVLWTYGLWFTHVKSCWSDPEPTTNDNSTFVIDIDPLMKIDCAIALMAATHFAMDTALHSMTRLLTVSCTDVDQAFVRLSQHHGLAPPKIFRHDGTSWYDTQPGRSETIYCESTSEVAERFNAKIGNLEGKQIVLVFHSVAVANKLNCDDWACLHIRHPPGPKDEIEKVFNGQVKANAILVLPDRFHSPVPLSGFDHVHVVVQSKVRRSSFDFAVGQTTSFLQVLSIQERSELRSFFHRFGSRPSTATFYVMDEQKKQGKYDWWQQGPLVRRQDVWNRTLGAFMAIVASLGPNVDPVAAVQCFVPEGVFTKYLTMAYRLQTHGILKWNEDERLTMGLEGRELAAFLTVLPFVDHDYRLAYFIAQDSPTGSDDLLQTKVQLAAVINSGGISMFDFETSLGQSADTLQKVVSACTGYSQPLSDQGNMWLALGLWKRFAHHTNSFQNIPPSGALELPGLYVKAKRSLCFKAFQSWWEISSALATCGIKTAQKRFGDESNLSTSECYEIQSHLFRAYLSQLTSCCRDRSQKDVFEFLDISSKRTINGLLGASVASIDFGRIPDNKPAFGIYHSLIRFEAEVYFKDWTMIPPRIVTTWVEQFRHRVGMPRLGIESMLRTDGSPRPNYDGIYNEVWKASDW
ncbi:uncharacterized protein BKA55DRAFT_567297 [Fusarium redolens]|uniref:Uncharacterized protein n=1 Tax=Fusarium redolens TaxID=48865 RepID=A0A9P9K9F3_FUSRE|nr:uncharacterized protein BKA55DRAFT_567297 [Fusarium redolens]KAH7254262.1 hypothetical protein BKA55DRAFT_567297 [Fusarium redolens]